MFLWRISCFVTNAQDQNSIGTEVYCRTQGRRLPHRAIAEELAADANRRENHGHRDAGHHMIEIQVAAFADPARAFPATMFRGSLKKRC